MTKFSFFCLRRKKRSYRDHISHATSVLEDSHGKFMELVDALMASKLQTQVETHFTRASVGSNPTEPAFHPTRQ
jgi:hypothetical protein